MKAEDLLGLLRNVKDPETGASILELGIVSGVEVENDVATVYVTFNRTVPNCKACVPIAWLIINSIIRKIEKCLRDSGFSYKIVESSTGQIHAEG
jgi:metal-sulfur cluster biosynthetic enzyme